MNSVDLELGVFGRYDLSIVTADASHKDRPPTNVPGRADVFHRIVKEEALRRALHPGHFHGGLEGVAAVLRF